MRRLLPLLCLLAMGCDVTANPDVLKPKVATPAVGTESDELRGQLKAVRAEVAKLKAELASRPAVDTAREQKLAIGRFIRKQQSRNFQIAVGSLSDAQLAVTMPKLVRLRNGGPTPADEYWELDALLSKHGGALNSRWLSNVDWSTNPERKEFIDSLAVMVHSMTATEYAAKLNAAKDDDELTMLIFDWEMEVMENEEGLIRETPTPQSTPARSP